MFMVTTRVELRPPQCLCTKKDRAEVRRERKSEITPALLSALIEYYIKKFYRTILFLSKIVRIRRK